MRKERQVLIVSNMLCLPFVWLVGWLLMSPSVGWASKNLDKFVDGSLTGAGDAGENGELDSSDSTPADQSSTEREREIRNCLQNALVREL